MSPSETEALDAGQQVSVPLDRFVLEIAGEAARAAMAEHIRSCPIDAIQTRVRVLELRFAALVGLMAGSGVLGGTTAAFLTRWLAGA